MKVNEKYCQSCSMPMGETDEMYGSNADGGKNADYCKYCFARGAFTSTVPMNDMIEICVAHIACSKAGISANQARNRLSEVFPTLKRWRKD